MSGSPARRALRKWLLPPTKRNLLPTEALQVQHMQQAANNRRWEADVIKGNTALVPDGQKLAEQAEAIANLLEQSCQEFIANTLVKCGIAPGTKCSLNLTTGEIIISDEARDH